jgi:iron complex transport system substrate-binding protein
VLTAAAVLLAPQEACCSGDAALRVVSLAPSLTREVYDLQAGDLLVGATSYCPLPGGSSVRIVGSPGRINIEGVYALRPDLVLASTDCNGRSDVDALRRLGCTVKVFAGCESFSCMCESFLELGGILDRRARAEAVLKDVKARLAGAQDKLRGRARPRVFWQIGAAPLVTASNATFSGEFLVRAGAENIFGDAPTAYPRVNAEEVLRRNPDVIIVVSRMEPGAGPSPWERFNAVEAVKKGRIVELDADLVCQPTPLMFLRGFEAVAAALYPGAP